MIPPVPEIISARAASWASRVEFAYLSPLSIVSTLDALAIRLRFEGPAKAGGKIVVGRWRSYRRPRLTPSSNRLNSNRSQSVRAGNGWIKEGRGRRQDHGLSTCWMENSPLDRYEQKHAMTVSSENWTVHASCSAKHCSNELSRKPLSVGAYPTSRGVGPLRAMQAFVTLVH